MTARQPIAYFSAIADFKAGKDRPRDFLERCLARLDQFEPVVGAFVPTFPPAQHRRRVLFAEADVQP